MKKVLYVSNIEVPYRTEFFNQLSEKCDLTVLYERKKSSNRNEKWTSSTKSKFKSEYLNGIKIKNEYCFNPCILKYVFSKKFDKVIIGCYNSPSQILAILFMRLFNKKFIINLDGEYFLDGNDLKSKLKRFFLKGASTYIIAGEKSAANLSKYIDRNIIIPYYFSSLTKEEIMEHSKNVNLNSNNSILIVGQYFDYKGLDIAIELAEQNKNCNFKFIGSGKRSILLENEINRRKLNNIEIIPFLTKDALYNEYKNAKLLLLPSRKECWGLVINEAASFGCPIISTNGCGAAIEFISDYNFNFISKVDDVDDLNRIFNDFLNLNNNDIDNYKKYLINKSTSYYIENSVDIISKELNK